MTCPQMPPLRYQVRAAASHNGAYVVSRAAIGKNDLARYVLGVDDEFKKLTAEA